MAALESFLSYVPLTDPITKVLGGVPKVVPDAFFSTTEDVMGDRARNITLNGTRQVATVRPYGSPPRQTERLALGNEDIRLLHSIESMPVSTELYTLFQQFDSYEPARQMASQVLAHDAENFALRQANLMTAAVQSMLSFGKLWFDADGNLQTSSSGADLEVDYGVPAGNRNQVGGIIAASWATAATNIVTQVTNLQTYAIQLTGHPLKYAFYGKNIPGYLANNTNFQQYLARNNVYNDVFKNTGGIAPGTLDLTWVKVQDAFFVDENNAVQEIFPADQITFFPEISKATYALYKGSYPVPTSLQPAATLEALISANTKQVYGEFGFAYMNPALLPIGLTMVRGNTFLPRPKIPLSMFIVDVTP